MTTVVDVMLLFAMATASVVLATTQDEGENGDVTSILNTMQVKIFIRLKLLGKKLPNENKTQPLFTHSEICMNGYRLSAKQTSGGIRGPGSILTGG